MKTMLLYVSKRFDTNVVAQAHLKALKDILGEENVFVVDLRLIAPSESKNYIAYGKYKSRFSLMCRLLQGNSEYLSNNTIKKICRLVSEKRITSVFVEDSIFGNLVKRIKKKYPSIIVFSYFHDIAADLYLQWKKNRNFIGRLDCDLMIRQERIQHKYAEVNLVFNQRDNNLYKKFYGKDADYIIPLSWDAPTLSDEYLQSGPHKPKDIIQMLFVGSKYWPNILGIKWFYENVFPDISERVHLTIVGRGTEILKKDIAEDNILIIGGVDDLGRYYMEADVVILPLFDGGGMKTKTAEALAFGKTIVGSTEGFEGYWEHLSEDVKNVHAYRTNESKQWIEVINTLYNKEIKKFNKDVYDDFVSHFSYQAMKISFEKMIRAELR